MRIGKIHPLRSRIHRAKAQKSCRCFKVGSKNSHLRKTSKTCKTLIFWFQIFLRIFVCANRLCRGQRPIHKKCLMESNELLRIFVRIFVLDYLIINVNYSEDSHRRELSVFNKILNYNPDQNALDYLA